MKLPQIILIGLLACSACSCEKTDRPQKPVGGSSVQVIPDTEFIDAAAQILLKLAQDGADFKMPASVDAGKSTLVFDTDKNSAVLHKSDQEVIVLLDLIVSNMPVPAKTCRAKYELKLGNVPRNSQNTSGIVLNSYINKTECTN